MPDPLSEISLEQLRRRTSAKWRRYPDDVLPMWVAEMDVALAAPIAEAIAEAIELGDTGYPAGSGYAVALSGFAASRWGWSFPAERAGLVADVIGGVGEAITAATEPGDAVVINTPIYPPFFGAVRNAGRRLLECPLDSAGRIDLERLEAAFGGAGGEGIGPKAFLLCSPHNPTGTVHEAAELTSVAELAQRHGVRVIADEIHAPLVYSPARFVPYLSLPGSEDALAVHSASKAWNLAGIKAALLVAGEDSAGDLGRIAARAHPPSHLGVIAHTAALNHAGEWLDELMLGLERNRGALAELVISQLPAVRYRPPQATFLAWLDCCELGLGDDPSTAFLERGRVALNPGPSFGRGGEGHVRLNFACSPELLAEGVRRMAEALPA